MKIGIMQPTYLPWLGYFELVDRSDMFILLDDVSFRKKTWHHRNRIKGANGPFWLTVPVRAGKHSDMIQEVHVNWSTPWSSKHLKSIALSYAKSPFLGDYLPLLEEAYRHKPEHIVDLNHALLSRLLSMLGITTPLRRSSDFAIEAAGNEKILAISRRVAATELYDAAGSEEFITRSLFQKAGIKVTFQAYAHPSYRQLHHGFIPYLSVIDLLFNHGPESLAIIRSGAAQNT